MKAFAQEIADGIAERILANISVSCLSVAEVDVLAIHKPLQIAIASANPNQNDLFYLKSVLVSTGWNNNDDVFLADQLWNARSTPEDKQFNFMHNEKDIIGHMTGSYVADFEHNQIDHNSLVVPDEFNIINTAVIYTSWTDAELQARADLIVNEIKDGKWFVSMECLFPTFDYCLQSEDGSVKYITRNEATAYLSKHLRAYGGTGVYQGYKVGRVLRDLAFSGVGLVNKPANPRSLIIEADDVEVTEGSKTEEVEAAVAEVTTQTVSGETDMSKELELELEGVKAKLVEAEATIASLTTIKTQAETLEVSVKDLQSQLASAKAELEGTKVSLAQVAKAKEEAEAKWQGFEKKVKSEKRKASLAEAGMTDEDLADLSHFDALDDAAFDKVVAAMKKVNCKVVVEKEDKTEDKPVKGSKAEETEAEDISITVETEKTQASLNDIAQTPASLHEAAASWFGQNVLKTSTK